MCAWDIFAHDMDLVLALAVDEYWIFWMFSHQLINDQLVVKFKIMWLKLRALRRYFSTLCKLSKHIITGCIQFVYNVTRCAEKVLLLTAVNYANWCKFRHLKEVNR